MKHIAINQITSITADYADVEFPATNMLDDKPKRVWKAGGGVSSATVSIEVSGECSDIAIFGTNAITATFDVYDPNAIEWGDSDTWGDTDTWANSDFVGITGTVIRRENTGAMWIALNQTLTRPCIADLYLLASGGDELYAGITTAGLGDDFNEAGMRYGLSEDRRDYSVTAELSNGARYYKKRDIARTFSGSVLMLTTDYHRLIDTFDTLGSVPSAWKMTDINSTEWLIFGYPSISCSHDYSLHSTVNIQINEVV